MRRIGFLLLLAACAAPGDGPAPGRVAPVEVALYRDTVTARMSDRSLCTGVRAAGQGPWRTTLSGCPHTWPVAVLRLPDRPRQPLVPAAAGEPWVVLTPPGGAALGFGPAGS